MAAERPSRAFRRTAGYRAAAAQVGQAVRARRQELGWTLEIASERMGLDFRHLQQIEAGTVNVTLATVLRIAGALDVAPGSLLDDAPAAPHRNTLVKGSYPAVRARPNVALREPVTAYLPNPPPEPRAAADVQRDLGRAIARFRQHRTQRQLAEQLGVTVNYVQRVEAGAANVTLATLVKFANALGVAPEHLLMLRSEDVPKRKGRPKRK